MRDLKNNISVAQSLAPAARTAAANGTGVDLQGYESACVVIDVGTVSGTSPSFTFEVQESDDNSTFTAVGSSDLIGTEPVITASTSVTQVGYIGSKRYIRAAITTVSGTSPSATCSASVVRGHARSNPA